MSESGSLTVLTAVRPGLQERLLAALAALGAGPESPLARLPGTHFARWVHVPFLSDRRGRALDGAASYLLFAAWFDGGTEAYLAALCTELADTAHALWSHCLGYPAGEPEGLGRFLLAHRVPVGYPVCAYPGVSVEAVRDALELRARLGEFALEAQGLDPVALHSVWVERFPRPAASA